MTMALWTVGEARPLGAIPRDGPWREIWQVVARDSHDLLLTSATTTYWRDNNMLKEGTSIHYKL